MKVHVGNTKTYLEFDEESQGLIDLYESSLMKSTGVRVDGFQFDKRFKLGIWDGYTHIYDKKTHMIPTGLWEQLDEHSKEFQRSHSNFTYTYLDERGEEYIAGEDFPEELKVQKGNKEITLYDYQYGAIKESILNRIGIVKLSTNSGKCVVPETRVLTPTGYKSIKDILDEHGINPNDITPRELPAKVMLINRFGAGELTDTITVNGAKHVNHIKLNLGNNQEITDNHALLTLNKQGNTEWVEAKDLSVGDYVVTRVGDNKFGTNTYATKEEAFFIGLMIADGYIGNNHIIDFTNDQPELLDYVENKFNELYGNLGNVLRRKDPRNNGVRIAISSAEAVKLFHEHYQLGYDTSETKYVPSYILEAPKDIQLGFLSGYLETEGSYNTTDKLGMEVTSKSKSIIYDVQRMLLNMGLHAKVAIRKIKKYPDNIYYRLVLGATDTFELLQLLNFKTKQRIQQKEAFAISYNSRAQHNGRENSIPYAKTLLKRYRNTLKQANQGTRGSKQRLLEIPHESAGVAIVTRAMENNKGGDPDLYDYIMDLASGSYYFNKVMGIEDGGIKPTFDVSMPVTHSFIAEGNVNHNTYTSVGIINMLLPYMNDDEKVAYIVPSKNIFEQAIDTMIEQYGKENVGYLGDGKSKISKVNVIMMASLYAKLKRPDTGIKLSGAKRESQIFAQEIYPLFDRSTNLVSNLRNFLRNYNTKGVSYREHIKEGLTSLAYREGITDAKVRLQLNKEKVKYEKIVEKTIGDKLKTWQMYQDLVKDTTVVILDEAHHAKADTYYNTLLEFDNAVYKIAMTGSIDSTDKLMVARLKAIFGKITYEVRNKEMIERGISAKPTINMINIREPRGLMSKKNFQDVYAKGIVQNEVRNQIIAGFAYSLVKAGKQTLIIVNYMEHGEWLLNKLTEMGVNVAFTNGELDSQLRTEQLAQAKLGEIDILIATSVLDEGVDISGFRALIMAGGYKSLRLVLQRVGRVLRKKEDDNTALVYDFMERTNEILYKHSLERVRIYEDEGFEIKYLN